MISTKSSATVQTASVSRLSGRSAIAACCAAFVFTALVFTQAGCSSSEPLASDLAIDLPEVGRAVVGYNDTDYVYPIRVPNTNRYVQMRTKEPLDQQPTYEDYLKWKNGN